MASCGKHATVTYVCRYGEEFDSDHVTFNAGVYGVNLDLWRESGVHSEVSYWMNQVRSYQLVSSTLSIPLFFSLSKLRLLSGGMGLSQSCC